MLYSSIPQHTAAMSKEYEAYVLDLGERIKVNDPTAHAMTKEGLLTPQLTAAVIMAMTCAHPPNRATLFVDGRPDGPGRIRLEGYWCMRRVYDRWRYTGGFVLRAIQYDVVREQIRFEDGFSFSQFIKRGGAFVHQIRELSRRETPQ